MLISQKCLSDSWGIILFERCQAFCLALPAADQCCLHHVLTRTQLRGPTIHSEVLWEIGDHLSDIGDAAEKNDQRRSMMATKLLY